MEAYLQFSICLVQIQSNFFLKSAHLLVEIAGKFLDCSLLRTSVAFELSWELADNIWRETFLTKLEQQKSPDAIYIRAHPRQCFYDLLYLVLR